MEIGKRYSSTAPPPKPKKFTVTEKTPVKKQEIIANSGDVNFKNSLNNVNSERARHKDSKM